MCCMRVPTPQEEYKHSVLLTSTKTKKKKKVVKRWVKKREREGKENYKKELKCVIHQLPTRDVNIMHYEH